MAALRIECSPNDATPEARSRYAAPMNYVDHDGRRFEVTHVVDPDVLLVSLDGAIQGCAQVLRGKVVANLSADGRALVSARIVAEVAVRAGYGIGFPIGQGRG